MKPNPNVFPGMKPTSQLYFDLQAMIAENGGRLHLANVLECEMVKLNVSSKKKPDSYSLWSEEEIDLLIKNYYTMSSNKLMLIINRTQTAIHAKIDTLKEKGILFNKWSRAGNI